MKGRKYAIEAIAELHKKYPKLQYYIVGDGPCRAELEAQVEKANLTSAIHFTGWVSTEKLKSLYDKAHIFLHPSITASDGNQEGQGMVLIEAQAQGIPVIATRHNAFTETILDGITGLLAEEKTVEELVEKMDIVIRNPQTTASIIQNAKKRVDEFYNSEKLNNDLIHIYERL
jgi:colanic acid/amylovoran biosynthesis glycosyltransferase